MSDNEDFSLYGDGSPEPREGYKGFGYCYPNSTYFDSPIRGPSAERAEASPEPPVKVEVGESSTAHTVKNQLEIKEEVKEEIKEEVREVKEEIKEEEEQGAEWYRNWVRQVGDLSGEEDEEEVEDDNPKLLQARRKIRKIFRKARPNTPLPQLFKKFQRLVRTGNCQGSMIDAVWDAWQGIFHVEWGLFEPKVRELKRKMYERRHWYAERASWGSNS